MDEAWCWVRLLAIVCALMTSAATAARVHTKQEYCEAETFRATCSSSEVVIMESAKYGRMQLGRCVIRDYGYVGCAADVLAHMDSRCSGRRSCETRIPDPTLDRANPCPRDFKTYLEASYGCIQVHSPSCRSCRNATYISAERPGGYLASVLTEESGCGKRNCPWVLRAQPGQILNITLLDFALSTRHRNAGSTHLGLPEICYPYGTIREKGKDKPTTICGSRDRISEIYISTINEVTIEITEGKRGGNFGYFLLMYEILGCAEFQPPVNTWVKKDEDGVVKVGCVATGETWQVTCRDNEWSGYVGTCPTVPGAAAYPSSDGESTSLPVGILITIILAIAMVIGVLILTVGLVMIKRRRNHHPREPTPNPGQSEMFYKEGHSTLRSNYPTMEQKKQYTQYKDTLPPGGITRQQENDYAYNINMELRPLPSIPDVNNADDTGKNTAPSGGGLIFGPHGEGGYTHHPNPNQRPGYDHTYFTAPSVENGGVGPHYFELDPDGMPLPPPPPEALCGHSYPPAPGPPFVQVRANRTGPGHKSPEQENAENFGKEVHQNTSCQDLSGSLQSHGQLSFQESGNCSWP